MSSSIADIRKDYKLRSLDESDVASDPIEQFTQWWNEAIGSNIDEVNAMTLATADEAGRPSARIVLLKGYDKRGFYFFTNYNSRKGKELDSHPYACIVFFWKELERQIRITGNVSHLPEMESDDYFNSRPAGSKMGAWCSPQSQVIEGRGILAENMEKYSQSFADGNIPRPSFWGGYLITPSQIEFWQGRPSRLHDRIQYTLAEGEWRIERLAP